MNHETRDKSRAGAPEGQPPQTPITVLGSGPNGPPSIDRLRGHGDIRIAHDEATLRECLPGSEILLVTDFRTAALEAAWPAADSLRWVHAASAGVDQLMFDALVDSDIPVTNAQGIFDRSIAEYVLGAILMFAKDTRNNIRYQQQRRWMHRDTESIHGKRVLVAGAGSIGREIARLCQAVGMDVTGIARRARDADDVFSAVHAADDIERHLPDADYVVVAAPLTEATEHWFDARLFAAMPKHARFINIGRGPIVVTDDLVDALANQQIAGAALDVFEQEPLPEAHPLWGLDNVLISAHMAGDFIGWRDALMDQFLDNLARWRRGEELFNRVSKRHGYAPGRR
jgi:phosphoglycerate dehydrogenase-like enzyme